MRGIRYVDLSLFRKTSYQYSVFSPRPLFHKYRGVECGRIYFILPNGRGEYYYQLPDDVKKSSKESKLSKHYLQEFEAVVRQGFFPLALVSKLPMETVLNASIGRTSLDEAVNLYYSKFNVGKNRKRPATIKNEKKTLSKLIQYFIDKRRIYVNELRDSDLSDFVVDVERFKSRGSKTVIRPATVQSYKKLLKAFLNRIKKEYKLDIDPDIIDLKVHRGGRIDKESFVRTVQIPTELLDKVDDCTYTTPKNRPDTKELVHLYRVTGLCKMELATLSEDNLMPSKSRFDKIIIKDKPDCPTRYELGFTTKVENRHREIPLDKRAIKFIESQIIKHKDDKIFGKVNRYDEHGGRFEELIPYRFLFPIYRDGMWQRCNDYVRSIQSLLKKANDEFNLGFENERFVVHDFRTTLNEAYGDLGLSAKDRSYFLGHSEKVNESNYMRSEKKREIRRNEAFKALQNVAIKDKMKCHFPNDSRASFVQDSDNEDLD